MKLIVIYFFCFQIIYSNITTRERMPLNLDDVVAPLEVQFSYSVVWKETKMTHDQRNVKILKSSSFFPRTLEVRGDPFKITCVYVKGFGYFLYDTKDIRRHNKT